MDTKKLRQKILDLAIHGKLVPQDPNDEPASILLERICKEKEQLIKEGKIKAPKKSKSAGDTSHYPKEGPWKLPKGWCWTKLGEISDYGKCVTVPVSAIQDDEWVLELEDIEKDTGRILKQITKKERPINGSRHAFTKNQILYSKLRTYLNKVLIAPNNGYCTTEIIPISPQSGILPEYLNLVLRSPYFQEYTAQCGYGVKMPRLGTSDAIKSLIPVPPYGEQQRIIKSANKLADITERIQSEKEHLSEHITGCKSRILELAIYGKLVPQDPAEEPAIELLKRIKPDFTPSHNLHYAGELPKGWCFVRLGSIIDLISGTSYQKDDVIISNDGIRILRGGNIQQGNIVLYENDIFVRNGLLNENNTIYHGDIVLVASTGSSELIGKAALAKQDYPATQIGAFMRIIRPKLTELSYYLGLIFQSDYYKNHIKNMAKGTNINNIKSAYLTEFVISVPPLKEQHRIIERVSELFSAIDDISNSIKDSE